MIVRAFLIGIGALAIAGCAAGAPDQRETSFLQVEAGAPDAADAHARPDAPPDDSSVTAPTADGAPLPMPADPDSGASPSPPPSDDSGAPVGALPTTSRFHARL